MKYSYSGWTAVAASTLLLLYGVARLQTAESGSVVVDDELANTLRSAGFTGRVDESLEKRLGRPIDKRKAELGQVLFFDKFIGTHGDNSCAGCHSPMTGFADTQSIAIGVDTKKDIVGPDREGARNQRRTPSVVNNAFYPKLMLNGRFEAISGDPFDNSKGFKFPNPEGEAKRFPPNDKQIRHLLVAQAHIPVTELPEMAGFTKITETSFTSSRFQMRSAAGGAFGLLKSAESSEVTAALDSSAQTRVQVFSQRTADLLKSVETGDVNCENHPLINFTVFDHFAHGVSGVPLPPPIVTQKPGEEREEFRNEPLRDIVVGRLNANEAYRKAFLAAFPDLKPQEPITFAHVGQAIAEFEFTLTFANAPLDAFARGEKQAMTQQQKQGAMVFFKKANCVQCHAVSGKSNEMFSDFENHVAGIPQISPKFGKDLGNVPFRAADGCLDEKGNEDFGQFDVTTNDADRYKFRTSPLRNLATHPTFFHNGSFTRLEDALRYHLNTVAEAPQYDPAKAGVAKDLRNNTGPIAPVLERLDPALRTPVVLSEEEFRALLVFLREGLLDKDAKPENLEKLIPKKVPSGIPLQVFQKVSPSK